MIFFVLQNSCFPGLCKAGVTKNLKQAVDQLNRYVPSDFEEVWSRPVPSRKFMDKIRAQWADIYLMNGYFQVSDVQSWVIEVEAFLFPKNNFTRSFASNGEVSVFHSATNAESLSTTCLAETETVAVFTGNGPYITRTAAARQLGITPKTLARWENNGDIQVLQTPSGRPAYTREVLESLFQKPQIKKLPSNDEDYL